MTPSVHFHFQQVFPKVNMRNSRRKYPKDVRPTVEFSRLADEGSVDLSFDGKIAILTLNNVHKKNAMT